MTESADCACAPAKESGRKQPSTKSSRENLRRETEGMYFLKTFLTQLRAISSRFVPLTAAALRRPVRRRCIEALRNRRPQPLLHLARRNARIDSERLQVLRRHRPQRQNRAIPDIHSRIHRRPRAHPRIRAQPHRKRDQPERWLV